jgi:hypothetical protein
MAPIAAHAPVKSVDPEASEVDAADQVGARSFLRGFVTLFVVALTALCTASVLLDPSGVFGIRIVPAAQQTTRDDKARAFIALPGKPELLVLGSSRVWSIRPATVQLLIGLDVEVFDEMRGGRLEYSALLRPYAAPGVVPSFLRMLPDYLLGSDIVDSDVRSLKNLFTGKVTVGNKTAVLPKNVFKADGFVTWPKLDDARKNGTFDIDEQVNKGITNFQRTYTDWHALSRTRIAQFRGLLVQLRDEGVRVDVYIPPLHPRAMRELPGLPARIAEAERLLAGLDAEGLVHFHRKAHLADFGGDPQGFYDFQHMTPENGDRLLEQIFAAEAAP